MVFIFTDFPFVAGLSNPPMHSKVVAFLLFFFLVLSAGSTGDNRSNRLIFNKDCKSSSGFDRVL